MDLEVKLDAGSHAFGKDKILDRSETGDVRVKMICQN